VRGCVAHLEPVSRIGGMRHQSAANFVSRVEGSSAIVVSQDGHISVFGKPSGQVTQVRGLEILLP
jgi:DNA integrity scanning protein DisA with diadenylate cyclase activity